MDHNEERRADRETWEHHREKVNKFIRLAEAEGNFQSKVDFDCCFVQRGLRRLLHGRGDRPRRRHLLDQRVLLQRRRRPGELDLLLDRYISRPTNNKDTMENLRETSRCEVTEVTCSSAVAGSLPDLLLRLALVRLQRQPRGLPQPPPRPPSQSPHPQGRGAHHQLHLPHPGKERV